VFVRHKKDVRQTFVGNKFLKDYLRDRRDRLPWHQGGNLRVWGPDQETFDPGLKMIPSEKISVPLMSKKI